MSRTILLGIDGMDPAITEQMMGAGELPNFEALATCGGYSRLATITPPQSPVVWSSIATGLSPACHGIYDFIHRDPATYKPYLSLHRMERGRYVNPVQSETFWERQAASGVASSILKWPMGFPPRPFDGRLLAGLGVPDIRGMLGTYTWYTSSPEKVAPDAKGRIVPVATGSGTVQTDITGPFTASLTGQKAASVPLGIRLDKEAITCRIGRQTFTLAPGEWTPWLTVSFDAGFFRTVKGLCRFHLASISPTFSLYMTPINVAFDSTDFPLSHPAGYASELAEAVGAYSTLGMAEDTNAINDGALSDDGFLALCDGVMAEREAMFLHELSRFKEGLLACVFDTTDRIQHIFWRMHDASHPMYNAELAERYGDVIKRYYRWMDRILGTVRQAVPDAAVICCSDHGFGSFRRSVHINSWLVQNGYMVLRKGSTGCDALFEAVDWAKTKAFAVGFTSLYLNLRGREKEGTVTKDEAAGLQRELVLGLKGLDDGGTAALLNVHHASDLFPETSETSHGPDLILGFAEGYRGSWQTAIGAAPAGNVIESNCKKWSGDHCCDASIVPGVLFTSTPITGDSPSVTGIGDLLAELTQR